MYIILNKKSVVMGVTEKPVYNKEGNVGINEIYFFDKSIVGKVLEVEEIPSDYVNEKYKYVDGTFSIVEGWNPPSESTIEEMQQQLAEHEQAIDELSMRLTTLSK